ncbi:DNA polymerase Y family protein [Microbacterium sp. SSW1-59]|uniref:DNA polymerase Y family protein n=1 Tax=Microbacterium xanthum TaxID=3079794 RepID=UPI002AD20E76|nr:DNA polymerase Y family protein [Microbacterium sp. SSW1-59]MDZ8199939.1 DNA polymerase Y family protein [Microbacterium sp. SSW1-59]
MSEAPVQTRSLVLWVPDWPVVALSRERAAPVEHPLAVVDNNMVIACSAAARVERVRRGQRRRDAQARCPDLEIVAADPARDHRVFASVVSAVEERAPGVQIMRPGLCALRARGPARYYGGERDAAEVLREAVRALGVADVRAGIADGPFTAEQAARAGTTPRETVRVVVDGGAGAYLSGLSVAVLDDAFVTGVGAAPGEIAGLLARLGVHTLGQFAAMEVDRVRERFGERGVRLHSLAAGEDSRGVEPRVPPPELHREVAFEPPLEIADQVAFGMRVAAEEFLAGLGAVDLVCTELRVELTGDRGERSERVWLHPGSFDAASVVDRVRWQLSEDTAEGMLASGVSVVRISPEAVDAAAHHAPTVFGSGAEERVHHALSRVQAMLGHRGVVTPAVGGGRWLSERQVMVPWGDRAVLEHDRGQPWPGSLPDPLPGTVFAEPPAVSVVSPRGESVSVDDRGRLSDPPAEMTEGGSRRGVRSWAGPWPVFERTWDAARARRAHRFQMIDTAGVAWLLVCQSGEWRAEARYD